MLGQFITSTTFRRTAPTVKRWWRRAFFWPLYAKRKARFPGLGQPRDERPAVALLDIEGECACKAKGNFIPLTLQNLDEFARAGAAPAIALLQPTATVTDLDLYANFDAWRIGVSRATQGKYHRSANKARRLGYSSRVVGLNSYRRSVHELVGSKFRRSKGLFVWESLAGPRKGLQDSGEPPRPPACPRHWRQCWAVFQKTEDGERLMAFAIFIRAGNLLWVQRFVGHADGLADGATKLLIFDIMQWVLARDEPATQGIRYLLHGYVEEGGRGLYDWKRYLNFKPMLLNVKGAR